MKIIKPLIGGHDGSSFRELLDAWEERKYCEVISGPTCRSKEYREDPDSPEAKCWVNQMGDILLYDFPILDRLRHEYNMCLFGNTYKEGPKNKKWIFWPWRSRLYDSLKPTLRNSYESRSIVLGFIGTPTNHFRHNLYDSWSRRCDLFYYQHNKIEHEKYLEALSFMRYGLCLRGVGPKCLRDIELMGMGTVPVFTEGVFTEYPEPLIEGEHYICGKSPEAAMDKIKTATQSDWERMSRNCIDWFERNCSIDGSFKTTISIINR